MPSSSLPALSSSDTNQQGRTSVKDVGARGSASKLPFNQLLAGKMADANKPLLEGEEVSEVVPLGALTTDVEDALTALAGQFEGGKLLPLSGNDLPLSLSAEGSSGQFGAIEAVEGENALINWQQVQLDWSRTQLGTAQASEGGELNGNNRGQQAVDQLLLQQAKLLQNEAQGKATIPVTMTEQSVLTPQGSSFAAALQGAVVVGDGLVNAKGQKTESLMVDAEFSDLAAISQLKDAGSSATSNAPRTPVTLTLNQSLAENPAWGQAMAARIGMMVNNGVHTATMQLHPAELGSIHIQLSMQGDNTSVQFQAQNSEASELIEKMLPRLSHSLEQQGLRLDEAKVSHNPNLGNSASNNSGQQFAGESAGQGDLTGRAANADLARNNNEEDSAAQRDTPEGRDGKLAVDYYA